MGLCKYCGVEVKGEFKQCFECLQKHKEQTKPKLEVSENQRLILRQVFLKIASEQRRGNPEDLITYAKQLESEFNKWN